MTQTPDHVQIAIICDRCNAQLVVEATSREAALEKLRALIIEKRWQVIDRRSFDTAEAFGEAPPLTGAQDLCENCA